MKDFCKKAGLIIFVLSAFMLCTSVKEYKAAFGEPVDINKEYPEDYTKVNGVETELKMVLGCFLQNESIIKNKSGQAKYAIYEYYYAVPIFVEDEVYLVAAFVDSANVERYEKLSELSMKYLQGELDNLGDETIQFQGRFGKMDEDVYERLKNWSKNKGYFESDEEIEKYVLPLTLESMNYKNVRITACVMLVAFVLSIIMMIYGRCPDKVKVVSASCDMITINGVTYPSDSFKKVNKLIQNGKADKALRTLQGITNTNVADAKAVIRNWDTYWGAK